MAQFAAYTCRTSRCVLESRTLKLLSLFAVGLAVARERAQIKPICVLLRHLASRRCPRCRSCPAWVPVKHRRTRWGRPRRPFSCFFFSFFSRSSAQPIRRPLFLDPKRWQHGYLAPLSGIPLIGCSTSATRARPAFWLAPLYYHHRDGPVM